MNTRSKQEGYKVFVTKLAAEMFRSRSQKLPKIPPRSCQDTPKRFQDEPKIVPRGPNMQPRSHPDAPRKTQDPNKQVTKCLYPSWLPRCSEVGSKSFPKCPQEAANTPPRAPKMSPRSSQEVPKCSQDRFKRRQDKHKIQRSRLQSVCNQAGCQDAQNWVPRIPQDAPKKLPRHPQKISR